MAHVQEFIDPTSLSLAELRALRTEMQAEEDAVSFVRRIAQGRIDVVREETASRNAGGHASASPDELAVVFGQQQGGGSVRPPRDTEVPANHLRLAQLTELCDRLHFADYTDLTDDELRALEIELAAFEVTQSNDRRSLFTRIDALSAELVARYKTGGANVDSLLN